MERFHTIVDESGRTRGESVERRGCETMSKLGSGGDSAGGCDGAAGDGSFSSRLYLDEPEAEPVGEYGSLTSSRAPPTSPRVRFVEKDAYESRLEVVSRWMKTGSVPRPVVDTVGCFVPPNELDIPEKPRVV